MNDDQFTKLFQYIQEFRAEVNGKFDDVYSRIDRLTDTIADFVKQLKDFEAEQAARDAQWERLLEWAREVSKKTGVPLKDL